MGLYHSIVFICHNYEIKLLWTISYSRENITYSYMKWKIMLDAWCLFEITNQGVQVGDFKGPDYVRNHESESYLYYKNPVAITP